MRALLIPAIAATMFSGCAAPVGDTSTDSDGTPAGKADGKAPPEGGFDPVPLDLSSAIQETQESSWRPNGTVAYWFEIEQPRTFTFESHLAWYRDIRGYFELAEANFGGYASGEPHRLSLFEWNGERWDYLYSGVDGRYQNDLEAKLECPSLQPGKYMVLAESSLRSGPQYLDTYVGDAEAQEPVDVTGRVVVVDRRRSGEVYQVEDIEIGGLEVRLGSNSDSVDTDGNFMIEDVAPGLYQPQLGPDGYGRRVIQDRYDRWRTVGDSETIEIQPGTDPDDRFCETAAGCGERYLRTLANPWFVWLEDYREWTGSES
jgi:hypothetical protein